PVRGAEEGGDRLRGRARPRPRGRVHAVGQHLRGAARRGARAVRRGATRGPAGRPLPDTVRVGGLVDAPPRGLSFGRAAADYERGRPDCSDAAVDRLCEALGLDASSEVVDLAAGTGKLTRALVRRFARVTAVE